jgi:hypothetical protein
MEKVGEAGRTKLASQREARMGIILFVVVLVLMAVLFAMGALSGQTIAIFFVAAVASTLVLVLIPSP